MKIIYFNEFSKQAVFTNTIFVVAAVAIRSFAL
jgi:hypothetical protein